MASGGGADAARVRVRRRAGGEAPPVVGDGLKDLIGRSVIAAAAAFWFLPNFWFCLLNVMKE